MTAAMLAILTLAWQGRSFASDFRVEQVSADGSRIETGTSRWTSLIEPNGNTIQSLTFESLDRKTKWRQDYQYDKKGELQFASHESHFGELTSRWILAREDGKWVSRGIQQRTPPEAKLRFEDPAIAWFTVKKVKPGEKTKISAIDPSTFEVRRGEAHFRGDTSFRIRGSQVKIHVVQRTFENQTTVCYLEDSGRIVKIEQVFPKSGMSLEFILASP